MPDTVTVLPTDQRDLLGEGPWWSPSDAALTWVDIYRRTVKTIRLDGTGFRSWQLPQQVSFAVPGLDGDLLVGLRDGIHWLDPRDGSVTLEHRLGHADDVRLNDGKTDRRGRMWFGSMHEPETHPRGALYRADENGVTLIKPDVTTSNGLGWSPDDDVMYYTDSMTRTITRHPFDLDGGTLGPGRVFAEDPAGYVPDGLTVDAEGCVWSAKWDGGRVVRYAPDGRVDRVIPIPARRPTSCVFAGDDLGTLVITSAHGGPDAPAGDLGGSVFLLDAGVRGIAEHPTILRSPRRAGTTPPRRDEESR